MRLSICASAESSRTSSIARHARPVSDVITGRPPCLLSSDIDKVCAAGVIGIKRMPVFGQGTIADFGYGCLPDPGRSKRGPGIENLVGWARPFMAVDETRAKPEPIVATRHARIALTTVDRLPRTRSRARSRRQSFRPLFYFADSQWER